MGKMGIFQSEVKDGYVLCPHCKGKTVCDCASCGIPDGLKPGGYAEGICKVCKGLGQVRLG
jgi:hypothetical protein